MKSQDIAVVILGLGFLLAACSDRNKPTAQVLTSPDTSVGLSTIGTITNFPFINTSVTIFEDVNRGVTCYVFKDVSTTSTISCVAPKVLLSDNPGAITPVVPIPARPSDNTTNAAPSLVQQRR